MNARDRAIADDVGVHQLLMCGAAGCPNRWSVDAGKGRACSAHAWGAAKDWPEITRQQQDAETDRAREFSWRTDESVASFSADEKRALLQRLRTVLSEPKNARGWAYLLRDRESAGEPLNDRQRTAWRTALETEPTSEDT